QLSEMGVNATGALATHLGKTQAEVTKMVSAGEVDFQTFSDAMYATFGEAAYGANATFSGAMSNVRAALSRVSAKFADPALQALKGVFVALIPAINAVSSALEPAVASFTEFANALSGHVVAGIEEFANTLKETGSVALAFTSGLRAAFEGTGLEGFFASIDDAVGTFFETVRDGGSTIDGLKAALGYFTENCPALAGVNAIIRAFRVFGLALSDGASLGEAFSRAFSLDTFDGIRSAIDGLKGKIESLPQPLQTVISAFSSFGSFVASVLGGVSLEAVAFGGLFAAAFVKLHSPVTSAVTLVSGFASKIGGLSGIASTVGSAVGMIGTKINTFGSAVTLCGGGVKGLVSVLGGMLNPVTLIVAAIAALAAGFVYLMATNEGFRSTVMGLVEQIGAGLAPILQIVSQAVQNLAATVLPMLTSMINMLLPVIAQIITVILQVVAALAPVVSVLVATLVPIITQIIELVVAVAAQILAVVLPVVSMILAAIQSAMPLIQAIITAVMAVVLSIIQTVWPIVQAVIEAAMGVIQSVIETVWPIIQSIVETVMAVIQDVINIVTAAIEGDWDGVWNGIKALFEDIWNGIQSVVETVLGAIQGAIDGALGAIQGAWNSAWDAVSTALSDCWEGIKTAVQDGVDAAYNTVVGIKDKITGFFDGAGRWLYDSGKAIIDGLADGISGAVSAATGAISGVLDQVRSFLPFSPAKVGPFSGKGWTLYSGQSMTEALGEGVERRGGKAVRAMSHVLGDMSDVAFSAPHIAFAGGYSYAAAPAIEANEGGGSTYSFGDINIDARELENVSSIGDFIEMLKAAKDANGTRF
ncbi:MAG: hypothetical protein RSN88_09470, partial [Gordonibacter sp.]|uniref:hypothetical protein n=1 Tax=Gordonibacter sp. TaxID=1968902 RepID=UPI002FC869D8